MSEDLPAPEPPANAPLITQRGLSERSRQLLHGTVRDQEPSPSKTFLSGAELSLWWPVVYFVLFTSLADFVVAPLISGARAGGKTQAVLPVVCGIAAAQMFLIAIGLVFGKHSLANRLIVAWLLMLFMFVCWTAGYWSSVFTFDQIDMGGVTWLAWAGMAWSLQVVVVVGALVPLSIARAAWNWRLRNLQETQITEPTAKSLSRYTLFDLMMVMTMIGFTLAVPRFTYDRRVSWYEHEYFWMALAGCVSICSLTTLALLVYVQRYLHEYTCDNVWSSYALLICGYGTVSLCLVNLGFPEWSLGEFVVCLLTWSVSFLGAGILTIPVLRASGWRLEDS